MEGGDIAMFGRPGQACVFEGLIASRPTGAAGVKCKYYERTKDWDSALKLWKPNDLPLKSLIDAVNRLNISTEVITFLPQEAVEPIYKWLVRKGVTPVVERYETPQDYELDLRYNRSIHSVYVADQEIAHILGMRATVIPPTTAWRN